MAENPATWGPAERIVREVLDSHDENMRRPPGEKLVGLTVVRQITDALRKADLLSPEPLKMAEHQDKHDGEFHHGCKYCAWQREHNDYYPYHKWAEMP